jgi:hypothetical protein
MGKQLAALSVSRRALLARIQRHHARDASHVRKVRSAEERRQSADFVIIDSQNHIRAGFDEDEMEAYARKLEILRPYEKLAKG